MGKILGTNGNDLLSGTDGNDTLLGLDGNDTLQDSPGNDSLDGGAGNDRLDRFFNGGNDTLSGGKGDDQINVYMDTYDGSHVSVEGGEGNDRIGIQSSAAATVTATGGAGIDVFSFSRFGSAATIGDFAAGPGGDQLDLGGYLEYGPYPGGNPFGGPNPLFRLVQAGADTVLEVAGAGGTGYLAVARLANVQAARLVADNFVGGLQPDGSYMPGKLIEAGGNVDGTTFDDTMIGGDGQDTHSGGLGNDSLRGAAGDDALHGERGDDSLYGEAGNDRLYGGTGNDLLDGGDGDDTLVVDAGAGNVTLLGGAGNDTLELGYIAYAAPAGVIVAEGGDGDDVFKLSSHSKTDRGTLLRGGAGSDIYAYQFTVDLPPQSYVVEDFAAGAGGDRIDLSMLLRSLAVSGPSYPYVGGNPFATGHMSLVQNGTDAELHVPGIGSGGSKQPALILRNVDVAMLTAANFVDGIDPGGAPVSGLVNTLRREGGAEGGFYNDTLGGSDGNDTLAGNGGDDSLQGAAGADWLDGGRGDDTLRGGDGNDMLQGSRGADLLDGGAGNDLFEVSTDRYDVDTSEMAATMHGGEGADRFTYQVGLGKFLADGGAGVDTYQPQYGSGGRGDAFVVADFAAGSGGDVIDLDALLGMSSFNGGNPFAQNIFRMVQQGNDAVLQWNWAAAGGYRDAITLRDVDAAALTGANFSHGIAPDGSGVPGEVIVAAPGTTHEGGYFNDTLTGVSGSNRLNGRGGDDILHAGSGNAAGMGDTLGGGIGNDTLYGGSAHDMLLGGAGNDVLDGGAGDDLLYGEQGDDSLYGGDGSDRILLLHDGSGTVYADGGAGDDHFEHDDWYTGTQARATFHGGAGSDIYHLRHSMRNVVVDDFEAGAGGDRLDLTTLLAGTGYDAGLGANPIDPGQGYVKLEQRGADVALLLDTNGSAYDWMGFQEIAVLRNVALADFARENLIGGSLDGGPLPGVKIAGTGRGDDLSGGYLNDTVSGLDGDDHLWGDKGDDVLHGDAGNDTLYGGEGTDTVFGGAGDDELGTSGAGLFDGGEGDDRFMVYGATGDQTLAGGSGNDAFNFQAAGGASGIVHVDGGDGNDAVEGYLAPGMQVIATGGSGVDTYQNTNAEGVILVTDFRVGAGGDMLDLRLDPELRSADPVADGYYRIEQKGNYVVVGYDADGKGTASTLRTIFMLENVTASALTGANFVPVKSDLRYEFQGGFGNDTLTGTDYFGDSLVGGWGDDLLDGGGSDDTLVGGKGDDVYVVRDIRTTVVEAADGGVDTIRIHIERFTLGANVENLEYAGDLAFEGSGNAQANRIAGGAGNDTLDGKAGADTLIGGGGDDTYAIDSAADIVVELAGGGYDRARYAGSGAFVLAEEIEDGILASGTALTGNAAANRLTGNAKANLLGGGAGNDTLDGAGGTDSLAGGSGDDVYVVDAAGVLVTELAGEGYDRVDTTVAKFTLAANVEALRYTGSGAAFAGTGNDGGNRIEGGKGNDTLAGAGGDDTLEGAGGNDVLDGGIGADTVILAGRQAAWLLTRGKGELVLANALNGERITLRGIETIVFSDRATQVADLFDNNASAFDDALTGTSGADHLDGKGGNDTLRGGAGDDVYVVDAEGDTVVENADEGRDTVQVALAKGTYTLADNLEDAKITSTGAVGLTGNGLANALTGNNAANRLEGGAGNDTLDGGKGSDVLVGGSGNDTYYVDVAGDKVTELADGGTDTVITGLAKFALVANVENLAYTGGAAFALTGNALDNEIAGGSAGGTVDGGAGTDTYVVGGGFDDFTRQRPNGTDLVLVKGTQKITLKNVEQVRFGDGVKTLAQLYENVASIANDTLTGTDGNDQVNGLAGADQMSGGSGDDTYFVDNAGDTVIEGTGKGIDTVNIALTAKTTYTLGANVEHATITSTAAVSLIGNAEANKLTGNGAANALAGGGGNDTLIGGKGNDTLDGGAGDDFYSVDAAGDKVIEAEDGGYDIVETTATKYTLAANVEELRFTGKAAFTGIGNALDNVIVGGAGNDKLTGGAGQDTFVIGAGSDTITDFASGTDHLVIDRIVGNGDKAIDGAMVLDKTGGFGADAELVIFTQAVKSLKATDVAKAIGSATEAYAKGDTALFALHDAKGTAVYLFTSGGDDAIVSAGELQQIATLTGVTAPAGADFAFA